MSLPAYVVNWDELEDLLKEALSNVVVRDISDLYGYQRVQGFFKKIPAIQASYKIVEFIPSEQIILTGISYSQSAWKGTDCWDLEIGDNKIFQNVYTKEIGENKHFEVISPIEAGTPIKIILHNTSGNSRHVWVDLEYINVSEIREKYENK